MGVGGGTSASICAPIVRWLSVDVVVVAEESSLNKHSFGLTAGQARAASHVAFNLLRTTKAHRHPLPDSNPTQNMTSSGAYDLRDFVFEKILNEGRSSSSLARVVV